MEAFIVFAAVLLVIFLIFKIFGLSLKIFFKLLLNAVIGAVVLVVLNLVGSFIGFQMPINWITSLVTGIFGVPGVVLLIALKLLGIIL